MEDKLELKLGKHIILQSLLLTVVISWAKPNAFNTQIHPSTYHSQPKFRNPHYNTSRIFDVLSFGAKGDGITDDTKAFRAAWQLACQVDSAVLEVPASFIFLVGPTLFSGPCAHNFIFQVNGHIVAPKSPKAWKWSQKSNWVQFYKLRSFILQGDGLIDGRGQGWWSLPCKSIERNGERFSASCTKPVAIRFYGSYNVTIQNLSIQNSPQMHLKFDSCSGVQVNNISISSPGTSPNTDGIHLQNTQFVEIQNSNIQNGDDCISIQAGTSDLHIHDVYCGIGHGISIGGLGKDKSYASVKDISVHDVTIANSLNGVRIKTWQGGSGYVKNVIFKNINVLNIINPIVIDQYYCDAKACRNQSSALQISSISYSNIRGTYARGSAMYFACSDTVPCTNIDVGEVELLAEDGTYVEDPFCWNAYGTSEMSVVPPLDCLLQTSTQQSGQAFIL